MFSRGCSAVFFNLISIIPGCSSKFIGWSADLSSSRDTLLGSSSDGYNLFNLASTSLGYPMIVFSTNSMD